MASAYERLMNKGGSAYETLTKRVAEQPKVTADKAAFNTLTTPITKVYSDPITSMSKYAADAYNKVAQNLADPVQAANLQFAVAGMPRPTQNDINNLYNKLDNLKAQQLNQSYGEAYTGEYGADKGNRTPFPNLKGCAKRMAVGIELGVLFSVA